MTKVTFVLTAAVILLLIGSITLWMSSKSKKIVPENIKPNSAELTLTQQERTDFASFTQKALAWNKTWTAPTNCLKDDKIVQLDFADLIRKHEGQQLETKLIITDDELVVAFDPLHLYLVFPRLHSLGLGLPKTGYFCEQTYEEYSGKSRKRIDKINDNSLKETKWFQFAPIKEAPTEQYNVWDDRKKRLFEHVLAVATDAAGWHCNKGDYVSIVIPDFQVGDPSIHVLLKAPGSNTTTIEWINFYRDSSTGEFIAQHVKNFGLRDEIEPLIPLIKQKQVRAVNIQCSVK
jgi:hypothetical protein